MANNMSNYLETALLNAVFRATSYTSPSTVYVALYTSDPTDSDTGTEVSGGSYTRQSIAFGAPSQIGGKATITNSADITFAVATADWGTITHVGLRDASSGGNLLYSAPATASRTILSGDRYKILASSLTVDLD